VFCLYIILSIVLISILVFPYFSSEPPTPSVEEKRRVTRRFGSVICLFCIFRAIFFGLFFNPFLERCFTSDEAIRSFLEDVPSTFLFLAVNSALVYFWYMLDKAVRSLSEGDVQETIYGFWIFVAWLVTTGVIVFSLNAVVLYDDFAHGNRPCLGNPNPPLIPFAPINNESIDVDFNKLLNKDPIMGLILPLKTQLIKTKYGCFGVFFAVVGVGCCYTGIRLYIALKRMLHLSQRRTHMASKLLFVCLVNTVLLIGRSIIDFIQISDDPSISFSPVIVFVTHAVGGMYFIFEIFPIFLTIGALYLRVSMRQPMNYYYEHVPVV